jgi:hypothetical protein
MPDYQLTNFETEFDLYGGLYRASIHGRWVKSVLLYCDSGRFGELGIRR